MPVPFEKLEDKQRIVIIGYEETTAILDIVFKVLKAHNRKFDWLKADGTSEISNDAPIILIQADDHMEEGTHKAKFLRYEHHVMVIHHVKDSFPDSYASFEEYLAQYEEMADLTPKAGTILFNQEDHVANLIAGERMRKDIKLIEYKMEEGFSSTGSAAKAILKLIGINDQLFKEGLASNQINKRNS